MREGVLQFSRTQPIIQGTRMRVSLDNSLLKMRRIEFTVISSGSSEPLCRKSSVEAVLKVCLLTFKAMRPHVGRFDAQRAI